MKALLPIGGACAFGFGGGYLGYIVGIGILSGDSIRNSPSPGAGIAGILMFGISTAVGAVAGAAVGLLVFGLMNLKPKLIWIQLPFAVFGYGILTFGLIRLSQLSTNTQASIKAGEAARSSSERDIALQNIDFIRRAKVDLPALMGNLIYPGSQIVGGLAGGNTYPSVAFKTKATEQDVDGYYRPLLSEIAGSGVQLSGRLIRPGGGRTLLFSIEKSGKGLLLHFITAAPRSTPPADSQPEPSVSSAQSALEADPGWPVVGTSTEVMSAYGNLIYPGSHTNFASTTPPRPEIPASMVVLASPDSMSQAVSYYRPMVDVKLDSAAQFNGITNRESDGRRTFVSIQSKGGLTLITLSAD